MHASRSRRIRLAAAAAAMAAAVLLAPPPAFAHVPQLEPRRSSEGSGTADEPFPCAVPIDAPHASMSLYGFLASGEDFDVFTFVPTREIDTEFDVLVPAEGDGAAFRPTVTVLREAPGGTRAMTAAASPARRPAFFEPFTFETLLEGPHEPVRLRAGERYYLKVEPGPGTRRSGAYVVAFGGAETFSIGEGLRTFVDIPRIVLGLYGQAPFDAWPLAGFAVAGGAVIGGVVLVRRGLRRRRTARAEPR